jgi:hypothetical protein
VIVALALASAPAAAFEDAVQFFGGKGRENAATLGASSEGVYFTGAPRFSSLGCQTCHIDGPGLVQLKLGADPPDLFDAGYTPGQTYLLEVQLRGETKGLDYAGATCTEAPSRNDSYTFQPCNNNSFALEIDAFDGTPYGGPGVFCSEAPTAGMCPPWSDQDEVIIAPMGAMGDIAPGADAVFGNRVHDPMQPSVVSRNGATSWHLWWTAPAEGSGPVTVHVSAVDGNGGNGSVDNDQDPYGDDPVQATFTLKEAGASPGASANVGCAAGGGARGGGAVLALLLFAVGARAGRRRRR